MTAGRIWLGPEREPPHFERPTIFVEGRPPLQALLDALDTATATPAAIYFGAGRVDDHDPELLAIAVAWEHPVVLEVRSEAHASRVPEKLRGRIELVIAFSAPGWSAVRVKDDTAFPALTYMEPSSRVEVTDPDACRFACDVQLWPKE